MSASSTVKGTEAVSRRSDKARVNTKMFLIIIIINQDILRKYSRKDTSLRAESARAFTGRRCPQSGRGEDFLTGQPDFFTESAVTPERKVEKSFPMWEINRHAEG